MACQQFVAGPCVLESVAWGTGVSLVVHLPADSVLLVLLVLLVERWVW